MTEPVERARVAFSRQEWDEARSAFSTVEPSQLSALDWESVAVSAHLMGDDGESAAAWQAAHRLSLDEGETGEAARRSFWLAMSLMLRGETAQAGAWLSRTEQAVEQSAVECAASGYLLIPALLGALGEGDTSRAVELAGEATRIGDRLDDFDLRSLAMLGRGQALIAAGDRERGLSSLDNAMLSVTSGEVGPITSGLVYCAVILECMQLFDLERAAEWTRALGDWCDGQPALVPYRGQCLVHRSQLQQATGAWPDAIATAEAACIRLSDPPHPALGLAHYQQAELHRLVGAFDEAKQAYQQASRKGQDPMPGLALLTLARGDVEGAAASIRRATQEHSGAATRPALLSAAVEILCAAGDVAGARVAADVLARIATDTGSTALGAMSAQAVGAVLVADGHPNEALHELQAAQAAWLATETPYESARVSLLLTQVYSDLGDTTSATLEFENARSTFADLGAATDSALMDGLPATLTADPLETATSPLSERELEVLTHVAAGETNREIATALTISEHTVGRHLENIFTKLEVTSRAAATASAYEHGLL